MKKKQELKKIVSQVTLFETKLFSGKFYDKLKCATSRSKKIDIRNSFVL